MLYMTSSSTNSGFATITVTFDITRDQDLAQVDVQNRVNQALGRMPAEVRTHRHHRPEAVDRLRHGGRRLLREGEYDSLFLSNYLDVYVKDALKRVPGVGDVTIFGERKYSMRLWLDPDRLAARQITANDVVNALREQNVQVAAGSLGQAPAPSGQMYQLSVRARRAAARGAGVRQHHRQERRGRIAGPRSKDVGRAELGAETYASQLRFQGVEAVGFGVIQLPTANALDVERAVDGGARSAVEAVPARDAIPGRLQHDRRRRGVDPRSAEDARRSDRPRRARHLHLPADVAQHAHPGDHDPGLARSARSRSSS